MARAHASRGRKRGADRTRVDQPIDLRRTVAFRVLGIASKLTQGFINRYTSQFGIGLPEWRTLGILGQFGAIASIRIAELADMDRGAISRAVAWLEDNDLVRRIDDPTHKRRKIVALTAAGKRLHDRISVFARARQRRAMALLSPAEKELLDGIFEKLDRWADELASGSTEPLGIAPASAPKRPRAAASAPADAFIALRCEKLLAELQNFKRTIESFA